MHDAGKPEIKVSKIPQPKVGVKLRTPPFSFMGRALKVKVIIKNETSSDYPPEEDRFLLLDIYTNKIGKGEIVIPSLNTSNFQPPFKLKPEERRAFNFSLTFKAPALYMVQARIREVRVVEVKGTPRWEEPISGRFSGRTLILAGPNWQMTLEPIGRIKGDKKVLRCLSLYDVLMALGAVSAVISAVYSILLLFSQR